jgi:hypothetical protein
MSYVSPLQIELQHRWLHAEPVECQQLRGHCIAGANCGHGCVAGDDGPAIFNQCLGSGALSTVASMGAALLVAAVSMVLVGM